MVKHEGNDAGSAKGAGGNKLLQPTKSFKKGRTRSHSPSPSPVSPVPQVAPTSSAEVPQARRDKPSLEAALRANFYRRCVYSFANTFYLDTKRKVLKSLKADVKLPCKVLIRFAAQAIFHASRAIHLNSVFTQVLLEANGEHKIRHMLKDATSKTTGAQDWTGLRVHMIDALKAVDDVEKTIDDHSTTGAMKSGISEAISIDESMLMTLEELQYIKKDLQDGNYVEALEPPPQHRCRRSLVDMKEFIKVRRVSVVQQARQFQNVLTDLCIIEDQNEDMTALIVSSLDADLRTMLRELCRRSLITDDMSDHDSAIQEAFHILSNAGVDEHKLKDVVQYLQKEVWTQSLTESFGTFVGQLQAEMDSAIQLLVQTEKSIEDAKMEAEKLEQEQHEMKRREEQELAAKHAKEREELAAREALAANSRRLQADEAERQRQVRLAEEERLREEERLLQEANLRQEEQQREDERLRGEERLREEERLRVEEQKKRRASLARRLSGTENTLLAAVTKTPKEPVKFAQVPREMLQIPKEALKSPQLPRRLSSNDPVSPKANGGLQQLGQMSPVANRSSAASSRVPSADAHGIGRSVSAAEVLFQPDATEALGEMQLMVTKIWGSTQQAASALSSGKAIFSSGALHAALVGGGYQRSEAEMCSVLKANHVSCKDSMIYVKEFLRLSGDAPEAAADDLLEGDFTGNTGAKVGLQIAFRELREKMAASWGSVEKAARALSSCGGDVGGGGRISMETMHKGLNDAGWQRSLPELCCLLHALQVPCSEVATISQKEACRLASFEAFMDGKAASDAAGTLAALEVRRVLLATMSAGDQLLARLQFGMQKAEGPEGDLTEMQAVLDTCRAGLQAQDVDLAKALLSRSGLHILLSAITSDALHVKIKTAAAVLLSQAIDLQSRAIERSGLNPTEVKTPRERLLPIREAQVNLQLFFSSLVPELWPPLLEFIDPLNSQQLQPVPRKLLSKIFDLFEKIRLPRHLLGEDGPLLSQSVLPALEQLHSPQASVAQLLATVQSIELLAQSRLEASEESAGAASVHLLAVATGGRRLLAGPLSIWSSRQKARDKPEELSDFLSHGEEMLQLWRDERNKLLLHRLPLKAAGRPAGISKIMALSKAAADSEQLGFFTHWPTSARKTEPPPLKLKVEIEESEPPAPLGIEHQMLVRLEKRREMLQARMRPHRMQELSVLKLNLQSSLPWTVDDVPNYNLFSKSVMDSSPRPPVSTTPRLPAIGKR